MSDLAKKQNPSLYNIMEEHLALLDEVEQNDGLLSKELLTAIELSQDQLTEKAASYGFIIKKFLGDVDIVDNEIKRLTAMKKASEHKAEKFKEAISAAMQAFGIKKIKTALLNMYFTPSKKLVINDESLIPEGFKKSVTTIAIDAAGIKASIEAGNSIPGASIQSNSNLQIR